MVSGITNNSLIAMLFGPGIAQRAPQLGQVTNNAADRPTEIGRGSSDTQPEDSVSFSTEGLAAAAKASKPGQLRTTDKADKSADPTDKRSPGETQLSEDEQSEVDGMKRRDTEVRQHEQAHMAAAGGNARGGASFEFETGPDGKQYAVGGEVSIDTSAVSGNPRATIAKMQQIQRAALAPANPSSQDRAVAAQARAAEQQARSEQAKESENAGDPDSTTQVDSAGASGATGSLDANNAIGATSSLSAAGSPATNPSQTPNVIVSEVGLYQLAQQSTQRGLRLSLTA